MTEEVYVIQTKKGFKKYPMDKRNKLARDNNKNIITTMDFLSTYTYLDEDLAQTDIVDLGLNPNDYEVKKYIVTYEEVK